MKFFLSVLLLGSTAFSFSQTVDSVPPPRKWRMKAMYGLNGTQTSFVNWNAGGRNNVSALGFINGQANYKFKQIKWDNEISISLGGLQYLDNDPTGQANMFQKTDDRIEASSNIGYRLTEDLNFSFIGAFRTQMMDGFSYPNDSIRTSKFMAPGYLNVGLGIDYTPNKNFTLFVSPAAAKITFVQDATLANAGSFGVDAAVYDDLTGVLVTPGKQIRYEVGVLLEDDLQQKFNGEH